VPAFTIQLPNLEAVGPVVEIQLAISSALEATLRRSVQAIPTPISLTAVVDTGSSRSAIQRGLPTQLGLRPINIVAVQTPSSTNVLSRIFSVRLLMPNGIARDVPILEMPLQGQHIQCLIGRDVLAHSTFVYLGRDDLFSLSF
jgi:hypothetical protein